MIYGTNCTFLWLVVRVSYITNGIPQVCANTILNQSLKPFKVIVALNLYTNIIKLAAPNHVPCPYMIKIAAPKENIYMHVT